MSLFDDLPPPDQTNEERKRKIEVTDEKPAKIVKLDPIRTVKLDSFLSARKGERDEMQDAHIIMDDFKDFILKNFPQVVLHDDVVQCGFYGVYDGHGGVVASNYAAENLHKFVAEIFPKGDAQSIEADIKRVYTEVYRRVDKDIMAVATRQRPPLRDGSTAVNVLIVNSAMYIANIGDSKAVLGRLKPSTEEGGAVGVMAIPLTRDHSPLEETERARIQSSGAFVKNGRVCGLLEVSRAFGDIHYKRLGVSSTPDVKLYRLRPVHDRFLIIACDGVWKVFSPQEAVQFVHNILRAEAETPMRKKFEKACQKLSAEAILRMSGDNITVVLVALDIDSQSS